MDSPDPVTDISDAESEISQRTDSIKNPSSSKSNESNAGSVKRKFMDTSEEDVPKKIPHLDDTFADRKEFIPNKSNYSDAANKILSGLFHFFWRNNNEVTCNSINDESITSKGSEDESRAAVLTRSEQQEYLENNSILEEINTDDNETENNFQTSTSDKSIKNKIVDKISGICEITVADNTNTLPKIPSYTISEEDGFIASTSNINISIKGVEKNCSLVSSEPNMDCTRRLGENENCCVNQDHQVLNNSLQVTDMCTDSALLEVSSTATQSINDESITKWYECASVIDTEPENLNRNQTLLDYGNISVESLAGEKEISNQDEMMEIEEQISNSTNGDTMSTPEQLGNSLGNCSAVRFPNISHMDTLAHQDSQNSDFIPDSGDIGERDDHLITPEMQLTEIKLQNFPETTIEPIKEGSVIFKTKEQPKDKQFNKDYMDIDVEPLADKNKLSNKKKEIENVKQISNSSRCETMLMSIDDFSSAEILSNASPQQELGNNIILQRKSTETNWQQNAPEQIVEANGEVSVRSKKREEPKSKPSTGTKKRMVILKERELQHGIIINLMNEYIKGTKLEKFTSSDIADFVAKRMPNMTYFKVLHAVRIFILNNLKSGVLKKSGQKYTLGCRASDASDTNIAEKV